MSAVDDFATVPSQVVWSVVRAACRAIERPLKGSEGSLRVNQLGKAVVLNTFVDKEYNRKEPIIFILISLIHENNRSMVTVNNLMVKLTVAW